MRTALVDPFQGAINEHYGHLVGDRAIEVVADIVSACNAPAGRLGSDEFSILLKGQPLDGGLKFAEELHAALSNIELTTAEWIVRVTCSFGVGEYQDGDTVDDLIKRVRSCAV